MVRQVRSGHNVALTVDGPRGPAHVVQAGVVRLARITGAWILPITFSSSWPLFLRSWDRYLLPKPFSQNVVAYGEPFAVSQEMSDEAALEKIRASLDEVTSRGRQGRRYHSTVASVNPQRHLSLTAGIKRRSKLRP